jgi:hypothetical protein
MRLIRHSDLRKGDQRGIHVSVPSIRIGEQLELGRIQSPTEKDMGEDIDCLRYLQSCLPIIVKITEVINAPRFRINIL